jgi:hypothetical protein
VARNPETLNDEAVAYHEAGHWLMTVALGNLADLATIEREDSNETEWITRGRVTSRIDTSDCRLAIYRVAGGVAELMRPELGLNADQTLEVAFADFPDTGDFEQAVAEARERSDQDPHGHVRTAVSEAHSILVAQRELLDRVAEALLKGRTISPPLVRVLSVRIWRDLLGIEQNLIELL